jgi:uncharacterized membrane protein
MNMSLDPVVTYGAVFEMIVFLVSLAVTWGSITQRLKDHGAKLQALTVLDIQVAKHEIRLTEHDRRLDKIEAGA